MKKSSSWIAAVLLTFAVIGLAGLCVVGTGLTVAVAAWRQANAVPDGVVYTENVEYGKAGQTPLMMDVARPKTGDGPFPAVVCIHGGGWRGGNRSTYRPLIKTLAAKGFVAITVSYRFAPAHPFPAQIEDVKTAVRYLRANARELKIDPERIGATGGSAGGHLSLMLGTTDADDGLEGTNGHAGFSSQVQAVASLAGPTDLTQTFPAAVKVMLKDLSGKSDDTDIKQALERASPLHYLQKGDAPTLLIHGTVDKLVPYEQATSYLEACKKAAVEATLITIDNGDHGYGGNPKDWLNANVKLIEFFEKHLKNPGAEKVSADKASTNSPNP